MDKLQVEKERGITVKAQSSSLFFTHPTTNVTYLLNLIDTPGHVDFSYEVSRSMNACQGALLLVDCTKGVQAQTMANFVLALDGNLSIIPVINKIDVAPGNIPNITNEFSTMGFDPSEVLHISAKTGDGVAELFSAIVDRVSAPTGLTSSPLKALLFDSWFTTFHGVVCLIYVIDGKITEGDVIVLGSTKKQYSVDQVGILHPEPERTKTLYTGQVGYVRTGMRNTNEALIGDTIYSSEQPVQLLPGFKQPKSLVYAGIYPADGEDFMSLDDAIKKLTLTDASVPYDKENNPALGLGYKCGFLGLLHMSVFLQRLETEYNLNVIATQPTVPYQVKLIGDKTITVTSSEDWPEESKIISTFEPMVVAKIVTPNEYVVPINKLCLR